MQEAQNERQALKIRLASTEKSITELQTNLQINQEKIQKAREQKNKLNEEVLQIRQTMQERKQMTDKLNELLNKKETIDADQLILKKKLVEAENKLANAIAEFNKLKVSF